MPSSTKYQIDSDENSDFMVNTIKKIVNEIGPRGSGSPGERRAGKYIKNLLQPYCDKVEIEEFWVYPRAFLGWFKIIIISLSIAFIMFLWSSINPIAYSIVALCFTAFGFFTMYKQFMRYEEWTPKIFPYKRELSNNVIGTIKPTGEVKKRVVLSGHIDSAYIFNLIQYTNQAYSYFIVSGIFLLIQFASLYTLQLLFARVQQLAFIALIFDWATLLLPFVFFGLLILINRNEHFGERILGGAIINIERNAWFTIIGIILFDVILDITLYNFVFISPNFVKSAIFVYMENIPTIIALYFYLNKQANLGVIDNLTACAVCIGAAKILKDWKNNPNLGHFPKNTEVVIALFGSEEIGLRGSSAFAKKHSYEYNKIDTTCINFESLQESRLQTIYTREATTGTNMSPEVYNSLVECCKDLNIPYRLGEMPSIAGGTDATGLIKGGLKATTMEGLRYKDYLSYYHTTNDNLSMINEKRRPAEDIGVDWRHRNVRAAMEMALKISLKYIEKKDKNELKTNNNE